MKVKDILKENHSYIANIIDRHSERLYDIMSVEGEDELKRAQNTILEIIEKSYKTPNEPGIYVVYAEYPFKNKPYSIKIPYVVIALRNLIVRHFTNEYAWVRFTVDNRFYMNEGNRLSYWVGMMIEKNMYFDNDFDEQIQGARDEEGYHEDNWYDVLNATTVIGISEVSKEEALEHFKEAVKDLEDTIV